MSDNKDNFKEAGKNIGHAFKNFGQAMGTTMKVAFGNEDNSNGEGKRAKPEKLGAKSVTALRKQENKLEEPPKIW